MTMLKVPAAVEPDEVAPSGRAVEPNAARGRMTRWRIGAHVLAVSAILMVGIQVGVAGSDVVSADEGVVLAQSRLGASEPMPYWADRIDPEGRWFPFDLAERFDRGWFLYSKKPLYVEMVGWAEPVGGRSLVLVLHGAAVVAAALAAAMLSRRLRPGLEAPTLWVTALGSPLVFDGFWVIAHAPAAACIGWAGVAACRFVERRSPFDLAAVAAAIVLATTLRTEATLAGIAAFVVVAVAGARTRRATHAWLAGSIGVGTVGGIIVAAWLQAGVEGSEPGLYRIVDQVPWWQARAEATRNLVLAAEVPGGSSSAGLLTLGAAAAVALAWSPGCRGRRLVAVTLLAGAVVALGARLAVGGFMIPGVLVAFPVGVAALSAGWDSRRRLLGHDPAALLVQIVGVTLAAVLATSYASGGTGDWGARYVHLVLPLLTPVVVVVLAGRRPDTARPGPQVVLLTVAAALVSLGAVAAADRASDNSALVVRAARDEVDALVERGASSPIVISTSTAFGRQSWQFAVSERYLTVRSDEMDDALARIAALVDEPTWVVVIGPGDLGSDRLADLRPVGRTWTIARAVIAPDRTRVPGS